jgi:predicted oxidoreductase
MNIHNARRYIGDKLIRTASPHRILDPDHGPLIAVKLNILTRKTLGGFETDLDSRVFGANGQIIQGLYAAGEAAGFGGGGVHGYRSLEGTFPRRLPVLGTECRPGCSEGGGLKPGHDGAP